MKTDYYLKEEMSKDGYVLQEVIAEKDVDFSIFKTELRKNSGIFVEDIDGFNSVHRLDMTEQYIVYQEYDETEKLITAGIYAIEEAEQKKLKGCIGDKTDAAMSFLKIVTDTWCDSCEEPIYRGLNSRIAYNTDGTRHRCMSTENTEQAQKRLQRLYTLCEKYGMKRGALFVGDFDCPVVMHIQDSRSIRLAQHYINWDAMCKDEIWFECLEEDLQDIATACANAGEIDVNIYGTHRSKCNVCGREDVFVEATKEAELLFEIMHRDIVPEGIVEFHRHSN